MAKKILPVNLLVEENTVRFLASKFGVNIQSDEELNEKFFEREPVTFDVETMGDDAMAMTAGFTAIIAADILEKQQS